MVLENCLETWTEQPRAGKGKKGKSIQRERFINTMFLRGDGVILGKEKTFASALKSQDAQRVERMAVEAAKCGANSLPCAGNRL